MGRFLSVLRRDPRHTGMSGGGTRSRRGISAVARPCPTRIDSRISLLWPEGVQQRPGELIRSDFLESARAAAPDGAPDACGPAKTIAKRLRLPQGRSESSPELPTGQILMKVFGPRLQRQFKLLVSSRCENSRAVLRGIAESPEARSARRSPGSIPAHPPLDRDPSVRNRASRPPVLLRAMAMRPPDRLPHCRLGQSVHNLESSQ